MKREYHIYYDKFENMWVLRSTVGGMWSTVYKSKNLEDCLVDQTIMRLASTEKYDTFSVNITIEYEKEKDQNG